jgi:hypothetical protein
MIRAYLWLLRQRPEVALYRTVYRTVYPLGPGCSAARSKPRDADAPGRLCDGSRAVGDAGAGEACSRYGVCAVSVEGLAGQPLFGRLDRRRWIFWRSAARLAGDAVYHSCTSGGWIQPGQWIKLPSAPPMRFT